ncbi:hypothetical protein CT19431_MP30025 [Cupriavidus taiwanensis]|nr:hypothetical protein CT19431_MP30025 [Cupriavidus taiwanensis]
MLPPRLRATFVAHHPGLATCHVAKSLLHHSQITAMVESELTNLASMQRVFRCCIPAAFLPDFAVSVWLIPLGFAPARDGPLTMLVTHLTPFPGSVHIRFCNHKHESRHRCRLSFLRMSSGVLRRLALLARTSTQTVLIAQRPR